MGERRVEEQSKLNAHPSFVTRLHEEGREVAELWLHDNFSAIGRHSSWKLPAELRTH